MAKKKKPPPEYTVEQVVQAVRDSEGLLYLAARRLGCHYQTVLKYKRKHKAVQDVYEEMRGAFLDEAEGSLLKAVRRGEGWAVCFALKCLGKGRGYVEKAPERKEEDKTTQQGAEADELVAGEELYNKLRAASEARGAEGVRPAGPQEAQAG